MLADKFVGSGRVTYRAANLSSGQGSRDSESGLHGEGREVTETNCNE